MNVTEIARRLAIPPRDLKDLLLEFGFGVGRRAIKVDKRIAERILKKGPEIRRAWMERRKKAAEADKIVVPESVPQEIVLSPGMTIKDFAALLSVPVTKLLGELMRNGIIVTLNDRIDVETATIIAQDLGRTVTADSGERARDDAPVVVSAGAAAIADAADRIIRPPVVVILGHVDHGKTTLLDTIRKSNVVAGEAGGITQHIGAYQVEHRGKKITFIDTPGHEAFTTMRSRGAKIADLAILVVAADDGVQPQTVEALQIIKGSSLPLIVALNKMDRETANPDRVKTALAELGVTSEEWGGKTPLVPISAKVGTGISDLLEMTLLVTDLEKEKRTTLASAPAVATVIESHVDPGSGPKATVLVQLGTLTVGDVLGIRGAAYGKVRALKDWNDTTVTRALPGMPVVVLGLKIPPEVGDTIEVSLEPASLKKGRDVRGAYTVATTSIDKKKKSRGQAQLAVLLRGDTVGSLEAISLSLEKMSVADASVSLLAKGLGAITEKDVLHAEAAGAVIYGFNVRPSNAAFELARDRHVRIAIYDVIYALLDDARAALEARLAPEDIVTVLGRVQVLAQFRKEQQWVVVGGRVLSGVVTPDARVRVHRKGEAVGEGTVKEVRVGKEIVSSVEGSQEAGFKIFGVPDIAVGDVLEVFREEQRKRTLGGT